MPTTSLVRRTDAERETLNRLVQNPTRRAASQNVRRAHVLLTADADGPNGTDVEIAEAFDGRTRTVADLRGQVVTEGFDLARRGTPNHRVRGTVRAGEPEATMIAWRLAAAAGFAHWTLRRLAERAVTREIVESVRHETVRRTLKKTA